jgi:hypothetical protein
MIKIYNVKEDAVLSCTLGGCTSKLKIPMGHGASIQGKNEATISDQKVGVNIFPFGTCSRSQPPVPCTPNVVVDWLLGKKDYTLGKELALLNICIVPCLYGGIIKINESGQDD